MPETLLITGADSPLARAVIAALPAGTVLRAADIEFSVPHAPHVDARAGDLRDEAFVAGLLDGVGTVLHLAPIATRLGDDLATLDHATRGSYVLATAAHAAGVRRIVLGGTLDLFEQLPAHYRVSEAWRPRPRPVLGDLCAYLPERTLRELARDGSVATLCLRFGTIVDDAQAAGLPYNRRWLHLDDAVQAVLLALAWDEPGWTIAHITAAGERSKIRLSRRTQTALGYRPQHDFGARWSSEAPDGIEPAATIGQRQVHKVVIFGAGGPLAAAAAPELAADYTLRLADLRSPEELAAAPPQSPGAPQLQALEAPHETLVVDVTDPQAVLDACRGMDAIINCTVIRTDPVEAFRVNVLGAANVLNAALAHDIRRVVHTGPFLIGLSGAASYVWDDYIVDDVPPRPGSGHDIEVYLHSKYLALELCRIYAEHHGFDIPALLFCNFINPEYGRDDELHPLSVSWRDAARALKLALVAALPSPFEVLHINADLPHGVFPNAKAKRVLGWQPRDDLRSLWSDEASGSG